MIDHTMRSRTATMLLGLLVGLGVSLGCAGKGKGKGSRNPEECMRNCEQEKCAYDPYTTDNEDYLECLEACEGDCS